MPHTKLGAAPTLGFPIRLTATPAEIRRGAPVLGEHTREVMLELGYGAAERALGLKTTDNG